MECRCRTTSVSGLSGHEESPLSGANFAAAHGFLGYALALDGQSEPALEHLTQALSLSPHDPQNIVFMIGLGLAHYQAGRYNETVKYSQNVAQQRSEHFGAHRQLCAGLAQAGRTEEARATLERLKHCNQMCRSPGSTKICPSRHKR